VEGQPVTLTGEVPLGEKFWAELPEKRSWPDWDQGTARLKIQDAQLAAFAPLFPKVLNRQGTVNADLALLPGATLDGELTVSGARTRPLGTVGPIQDIHVKIKFAGRGLLLESASATLGAAPVTASGAADLHGTDWTKGVMPPFQIQLQGRRVPL